MLARLTAWLGRIVTPYPRIKGQPVTPRPPAPRTTGYQPRDTGRQGPPPRGGSSAMPPQSIRDVRTSVQPAPPLRVEIVPSAWMPQTTLNIPMPAGTKTPGSVCPCCGK